MTYDEYIKNLGIDVYRVTQGEVYADAVRIERERIRARAKAAAEKTWRAGDWYIGPQHANLAKFIDALLEDGDD